MTRFIVLQFSSSNDLHLIELCIVFNISKFWRKCCPRKQGIRTSVLNRSHGAHFSPPILKGKYPCMVSSWLVGYILEWPMKSWFKQLHDEIASSHCSGNNWIKLTPRLRASCELTWRGTEFFNVLPCLRGVLFSFSHLIHSATQPSRGLKLLGLLSVKGRIVQPMVQLAGISDLITLID